MIKKIIFYSLLFVFTLFAYRCFLYEGLRKNKLGIFAKYNDLFLNRGNAHQVLFLGSSRAEMHFHPKIFDSITGLNSYNMGISGASLKLSYGLLKTYCHQHTKPKYLILSIDYFALDNDSDRINDFPRFFPYLSNSYLLNELKKLDARFSHFYYNPFASIPYTQINYLSTSLHGWFGIYGRYDTLMYKGFQTSEHSEFRKLSIEKIKTSVITIKNRTYLDSIINFSKKNNIKLLLVTTPFYGGTSKFIINSNRLSKQLKDIAFVQHVSFFNYSDSAVFKNPKYFKDVYHLNLEGAMIFSKMISSKFMATFN
ncbi:MAG: hypothetical protein ACK504_01030 [Bacteroidota bacterium]